MGLRLYDFKTEAPYFEIPETDEEYASENGVLFNKDKTKLLRFPTVSRIKEYKVPDQVKVLSENAFAHCSLERLDLNRVQRAGRHAVSECQELTDLRLGAELQVIGEMMIFSCHGLRELAIPPSVSAIENYGIGRCVNLKEVAIPKTVARISPYPFGYKRGTVARFEANGAVLYVREEFPGTGNAEDPVDLEKYDRAFFRLDDETRLLSAYYRLAYPIRLTERWRMEYLCFLRRNAKELTEKMIREDDARGIRQLAEMGVIYDRNIDGILEQAGQAGRTAVTACLLDFMHLNPVDLDDLFNL